MEVYYRDLASSKVFKELLPEAQPEDNTHLIFSTKGKDNWQPLFAQLISAQQDGHNKSQSQLVLTFRDLTMSEAKTTASSEEESKQRKPVVI